MTDPTPEEKARAVFGARAATYTTSAVHTDREVLDRLVRLARPEPHWEALDAATGTGHTAFALAPHVARVVGTDLTPEMLAEARGLQKAHGLSNVSFQEADVHRLPFGDGRFDLAASRRAPHHFSDLPKALREIARVLKPGGRLVIDDRSVPEDDEVDRILNRLDVLHDASHVREYRPSEWRALLEAAGFRVESLETYSRLRPASHLKQGVPPPDAAEIDRILSGLTARQRAVLQADLREGEIHHLHFFVMIAAVRPA